MPKFSIIIPVYNVAPYLRECLDSVLAQTFTDWEAICVDDGSTDGSGAILDEYKETVEKLGGCGQRTGKFVVIHQQNAGVSAARNAALDVAQGEWIGFIDADDKVARDWLEHIWGEIEADDAVEVFRTGCISWHGETSIDERQVADMVWSHERLTSLKTDEKTGFWALVSRCAFPFILFVRRSKVVELRFVKGIRFREDALFQFALAARHPRFKVISEHGYWRRERSDGATQQRRRRDDTYKLLREYAKIWRMMTPCERDKNRDASTFWVVKDILQWLSRCPDRTVGDGLKVWVALWTLVLSRGFNPFCQGTRFDGLRWTVYLLTSFSPILFFTRLSFRRH